MEVMYQTNVGTSICYVALKTKANNIFAKINAPHHLGHIKALIIITHATTQT